MKYTYNFSFTPVFIKKQTYPISLSFVISTTSQHFLFYGNFGMAIPSSLFEML